MKLSKLFLFVPVLLVIFAYLFYSAYKEVKDKTLDEFNYQQFAIANQASMGIENFFNYYEEELTGISKISFVSELNDQGKSLLTTFYHNHSDQIEAITVVDAKGIIKYTFPYVKNTIGQDISNQKHVREVIETHKPTVSDVFFSVQGYRAIAFHIPMISGNEYIGSLAILIPVDRLGQKFIKTIKTRETGYGLMMSETGMELFDPLTDHIGKSIKDIYNKNKSVLDLFDKTIAEKKGTAICYFNDTSDIHKKASKSYASYFRVPLGNTFWTILIFTPEKEVFSTLASFRNRLVILFSLVIFAMVVYFFLALKAGLILKEERKRKALEKVLRESEKRFRIMFELSPVGIILIDENGIIIEVNSSYCNIIGYSRQEILSKNIRLFSSPREEGEIEKNIAEILSGKTLIHEVTDIRKDGTHCEIALYETMIMLPDGKPGILSVSNDITEKKRSEEKMMTLSRALESVSECVSITDNSNKIIFVNNAFCKTYGYTQKELIGVNIEIVRAKNDNNAPVEEILSDTIRSGWNGELINERKDGSKFPIELSTSPIKDEKGNSIALIGIAVDITERKKVYQELISSKEKAEESDKLKSAFLANISHELRTPLNAIIGFSGLMAESDKDPETITNSKIILNSGHHLLGLVEDILDISLIETGQTKINYESVGVISVLNEVRDIIQGEKLKENKAGIEITLNKDPDADELFIKTDSRKLKQVLINLLKNALKFTDEGHIEFGYTRILEHNKECLRFYVEDTGIGIDKKYHQIIFNIFRQVDDTNTRKYGGTGIGLSIAKKIVEMIGGEIWVESEPGKGSIFYFTIPLIIQGTRKEVKPQEATNVTGSNFSGKTILIAEDEVSNYEYLRILLTRMNITVLWAKDGIGAINQCKNNLSIDMVLMDIKMPLLNGYDATMKIKKIRPGLPIIALTAYATASDREIALDSGCNDYISKPINVRQLTDVLREYL
ncbi:MAG: PAS domain S-box protein [Bacteroidales bacterium]